MIIEKKTEGTIPSEVPVVQKCPFSEIIKLTNFSSGKQTVDTLHKFSAPIKCQTSRCMGALMSGQSTAPGPRTAEEILREARSFQKQYLESNNKSTADDLDRRMAEITAQVKSSGYYDLTLDELKFGSKLAWRNAPRCIGRIQWNKLEVQDCRNISTTQEMFEALCKHLEYATNGGNLRSMITIFPPRKPGQEDFRMWNPQLLNFAGYMQPDGSVIGDPGRAQFTRLCQRLGWQGKGGRFDVLPWVLYSPVDGLQWYEIPEELILRVKLEHPRYPWFAEMDIKWYAVPAVADMMLDLGGLSFTAAPFNGWYMGTEIGARNLCDAQRYNLTQEIAEKMGLDTSTPVTLWKDTVLVEVNIAVLHSFRKNEVTIVDHHTASETFMKHMATEQKLRGGCPADWVWIVPPISGSITPVFHQEMISYNLKPSYEYQTKAWLTYNWPKRTDIVLKFSLSVIAKCTVWCLSLMSKVRQGRVQATILYATETGKSETFAHRLERLLKASFNVQVLCMEDYDIANLEKEQLLMVVASTFGNGEPPDNGKDFWRSLKKMKENKNAPLANLKYAVFALGSSQYRNFCNFGKNVDKTLHELGATRIMDVGLGDELKGQEHVFNSWLPDIYQATCKECHVEVSANPVSLIGGISAWDPQNFRLVPSGTKSCNFATELSKLHHKNISPMKMLSRARLQASYSQKQTLLVRLDTENPSFLNYEPGDHLGVFPENSKHIVNAVLTRLQEAGYNTEEILQLETMKSGSWTKDVRLPPTSLRNYLTRFLDITSPPSPHLLQMMGNLATDQWDKYRLKRLAQVTDDFEEWQNFRYPHLAEVLEEFPSIRLDASLLLCELPLLQPRYYSISSSPLFNNDQIHLTVTRVSYRTQDNKGPIHHGVCTSYLDNVPENDILCFIRSAPNFRLPENRSVPVIMIGAGSGIAPFRSFWQHREAEYRKADPEEKSKFGPMVLFFGCRKAKVDNIYEQETAPLVRKGILARVFTALSREQGKPKCYVQHELQRQSDFVCDLISQGGHLYVCGDAVIASDVRSTIDSILCKRLQIDSEALADAGRYHEDVFGISHRRNTS